MCTLQVHMQCYDRFFEVLSDEVESNELLLENIFSQLLLEFFERVMVEVQLYFSPHEESGMQHCIIHVEAQCDHKIYTSICDTDEMLEVRIEHNMCSILEELFCSVMVENVTFFPSTRVKTYAKK